MTPEEFFTKKWGTGFIGATLKDDKGLLQLSMDDIYETMREYKGEQKEDISDSSPVIDCSEQFHVLTVNLGHGKCFKCGKKLTTSYLNQPTIKTTRI